MNIQRFIAPTSREAMAKARLALGESAVILSTRSTGDGFEVMAAAEESIASLAGQTAAAAPSAPLPSAADAVARDTETLAMSTLSFQDYVRERMLRKRRAALQGGDDAAAPAASPVGEPPRAFAAAAAPVAAPIAAPIAARPAPVPAADPIQLSPPPAAAARPEDRRADVAAELSALKAMIEERFDTLAWLGSSRQHPVQSQLMLQLIRAGFSPAIARAVLERVPADAAAPEAARWLADVITRNLRTAAPGAGLCEAGGVVSLIGATGVGKTTTAAKLAAQCVSQYGANSVGLVTLDAYRVSGFEQLRAFGRMLGVTAHLAHDRAALTDLLNLLAGRRLVIVDTAGLGQRDQRIQDMLDVLDMPSVKKTLVLNAGAHGDTLDEVLTSFKASTLHGVVLSKVDEAVKLGPALDSLIRHQVTLRGVANGQRVPEDWQAPDAAALVRQCLVHGGGASAKAAHDPQAADLGFCFAAGAGRGAASLGGPLHV